MFGVLSLLFVLACELNVDWRAGVLWAMCFICSVGMIVACVSCVVLFGVAGFIALLLFYCLCSYCDYGRIATVLSVSSRKMSTVAADAKQ